MKIIVFGATGRVDACIVEQALQAGHEVTAFVHDRPLKAGGDRVSIVKGDVRDPVAVRAALEPGFDAVVVAIGQAGLKPSTVVTDGMHAIIAAMKECGIGRLLFVSGVAEMPYQTFFGRLSIAFFKKFTPVGHSIRDHDRAFEELTRSGLGWMLAGGPYIKDGPRRGRYHTSLVNPGGFKIIHPPDVADLIVRELTEEKFTGKAVGIWY